MLSVRVAGSEFSLSAHEVERHLAEADPEPIRSHYAVVNGRRFPLKQVLALVTGLDRADFTTHQARSILRRLGFGVYPAARRSRRTRAGPRRATGHRARRVRRAVGRSGRRRRAVRRGRTPGGRGVTATPLPCGARVARPGLPGRRRVGAVDAVITGYTELPEPAGSPPRPLLDLAVGDVDDVVVPGVLPVLHRHLPRR